MDSSQKVRVTKSERECYELSRGMDWATILVRGWSSTPKDSNVSVHGGELFVYSSFGTWGHHWSNCGKPIREFLIGLDFLYLFTKFMGQALYRFDGPKTYEKIKHDILKAGQDHELTAEQTSSLIKAVESEQPDLSCSVETVFSETMLSIARSLPVDHPMYEYFSLSENWPREWTPHVQAVAFWETFWVPFTEALRQELAQEDQAGPRSTWKGRPIHLMNKAELMSVVEWCAGEINRLQNRLFSK